MTRALVPFLLFVAACSGSSPAPLPEAHATPASPLPVAAAAVVVDAGAPVNPAFATLPPSMPIPPPARDAKAVTRSGKTWPFHRWDHAEAVVFNWQMDEGPTQLRAYDENGWSPNVKYRTALDADAAKRSVDLALQGNGELLVSKCAFPRHAVVLYDGDQPVASINVCFTCHDVLLWPHAEPTDAQIASSPQRANKILPEWHALFVDDLHFPLWSDARGGAGGNL